MRVGFIGTGHMGNPISRHLIRTGHELLVHDLRQEATANLIELGATWAESPRAAAAGSEVVFTSLPGPAEVDDATLSEDGILAGAAPGTIHVDLSTNALSAVRRLAKLAAARGVAFLDAPLSGGERGAIEGSLTVFVGGDAQTLEAVRPLLEAFGKDVFHVGEEVGLGAIGKLTNQMIGFGCGLVIQEALAVGVKAGVDPMKLYEMWNVSTSSRYVQGVPGLLNRQFDNTSFTLRLAGKDVGLCVEAARDLNVPMTVGSAVSQVFIRSIAGGLGGKFINATLLQIEEEAGVKIEKR